MKNHNSRNPEMDTGIVTLSYSEKLTSHYPGKTNSRNRGPEPKIKLKKLRSIKLSGLPSLKSFKSRSVFRHDHNLADILFTDETKSEQSTATEVPNSSSNYIKSTNRFSPTDDFVQKPVQTLTSRSNLKLRRPSMRRKHTNLRSIKFNDSGSSTGGDTKCRDIKETPSADSASSFNRGEKGSQASPSDSDSSSSSDDLRTMQLKSLAAGPTGHKTARKLLRKSSIKPNRICASMKAKKASLRKTKSPEHPYPYSGIARATCSSILKNSKVPDKYNLEGIEKVCEEISTGKVCTYSYCSIHGNRNATEHSLKRFSSMRRRRQKNQKSLRLESGTLPRAKLLVNINQTKGKVNKHECLVNETKDTGTRNSDAIQKTGCDFASDTRARPKVQSKDIGIQTEAIDFSDNESPAQNPLSKNSDISTKESRTLVTSPVMIDSAMDVAHLGMIMDDALPEDMDANQEEEHIVALSPGKAHKLSMPCNKFAPSDYCLSVPENPSSPAMLCVNSDDAVRKCSREVPVDGNAILSEERSSTGTASDDYCFGSKSNSDPLEEAAREKEDKGTESEVESSQRISTIEVPEHDSRVGVAHSQFAKQKNDSLWHLIYQNMASQLPTTDDTNLQAQGDKDIERKGNNSTMAHWENNVMSSSRDSEAGQRARVYDEDAGLQKVELTQSDAIKLVQEAINNILLLEVQGRTSDDHSSTSNIHQNIQEANQEKCLEPSVPTSDITAKEMSVDDTNSEEDGRPSNMMSKKPTRQLSKSWSSVRKIVLLRRFVKTLERIRNFGPQAPRQLPLELSPGSEKVHLRHQTKDGRRNTEEWMLDYALQQVISKLAPAKKKRVELLVKAFETMVPPAETESNSNTSTAPSSHANFVQSRNDSAEKRRGETVETTNNKTFLITSFIKEETSSCETTDTSKKREPDFGENSSESRFFKHGISGSAYDNEVSAEEKVILEVPEEISSTLNLEVHNTVLDLNTKNSEIINETSEGWGAALKSTSLVGGKSVKLTETNIPESSSPVCGSNRNVAAIENIIRKAGPEIISLHEHPGSKKHAQSYIHTSTAADDAQIEKKKQMKLWFMVYRRMLSGLAAEESTEKLLNVEEKQADRYPGPENHEDCQTKESYHEEAIKLVEEAIDGIVLTDNEDQFSDNQSLASYAASDQELNDDKQSEENFSVSASAGDMFGESDEVDLKNSVVSNTEETCQNSRDNSPQQQEKSVPKLGSKFSRKTSNHWNKVRKLMRFIKALDKVKKINPPQPIHHLPPEGEPEAETVNLKHQEADGRKNSEEWMLDYAMQQAVSRLTPARKKKVQLLVEAFETVMPTIKTEAH